MKKIPRGFEATKILIVLAAALLLAVGGWYAYRKASGSISKTGDSATWSVYKNDKYGFEFIYPKEWGNPFPVEGTDNAAGQLSVSFKDAKEKADKRIITIIFYSGKAKPVVCGPEAPSCVPSVVLSDERIQTILKGDKSRFIKHDSSSYSILVNQADVGGIATLNTYQIVNLPKMGVRAVQAIYSKSGDTNDCLDNKLSSGNSLTCITETNYADMKKVLNSINSIKSSP